MNVDFLIFIASTIGTIAFAISGALVAIECNLDIFGVAILGPITACGGGMLRDIMLNKEIGFFTDYKYILMSFIVSLVVFVFMYFMKDFSWQKSKFYKNFFVIIDSIGLGAFVVVGAMICYGLGHNNMFEVCFYGVLTACGGGLIRDIMVNKIPTILRKHIYAVASIIGAIYFYILLINGVNYTLNVITTVVLIMIIRYVAYYFELGLPKVTLKHN